MSAQIGIIGGSGLYDMAELDRPRAAGDRRRRLASPSGPYMLATLRGKRVAFLPRHDVGHRLMPSELNFRANIYGFKVLGVEAIISASAVGSLREELEPLDLVFPDQFIDRTFNRHGHVLRQRHRRARRALRIRSATACASMTAGARATGRRHGPQRRHLRLHGGPAVLDACRVEPVSLVGRRTSSG